MTFSIRFAEVKDVHLLAVLDAEMTEFMRQIAPEGFGETLKSPVEIGVNEEFFAKALEDNETTILVAEQDKEVVGFVMGIVENHTDDLLKAPYLTIQYLGVSERFRGAGIGKALLESIEEWASQKGFSTLELLVWAGNERAKALFHRMEYLPLEMRMAKRLIKKSTKKPKQTNFT